MKFRMYCFVLSMFYSIIKRNENNFLQHTSPLDKTNGCHGFISYLVSHCYLNVQK